MATPGIVPRANGEGSIGTSVKRWDKAYFNEADIANKVTAGGLATTGDITAGGKISATSVEGTNAEFDNLKVGSKTIIQSIIESRTNYYARPDIFKVNKTAITIPKDMLINIGGKGYITQADVVLQLSSVGNAAARKGRDVYVYACQSSSLTPIFVLSFNSTVPSGYTADNSRKIGGVHCLCADVGSISGHALSGYVAGDIVPNTQWDLLHRAVSANEGMVYVRGQGRWYDLYLAGIVDGVLVSTYNAIIADGSSTPAYNGEGFVEALGKIGKRPLWRNEFIVVAKGSNEETNIKGSTDPNTTGGHVDINNRRMISDYGLEDCCGVIWQWLGDTNDSYSGNTSWNENNFYLDGYSWQKKSVYNEAQDSRSYGSCIGLLRRVLAGAHWVSGSSCGSRASICCSFSSDGWSSHGCRGASEPRVVNLS